MALLRRLERDGAPVRLTGPWPYGTTGWMQTGSILPAETVAACRDADVILSGAVGTHPGVTADQCPNPEAALIELRHVFDLRISVRTVCVPGCARRDDRAQHHRRRLRGPGSAHARATATARRRTCWCSSPPGCRRCSTSRSATPGGDPAAARDQRGQGERVRHVPAVAADRARDGRGASGIAIADVNVDRAAYELVARADLPSVIVTEGIFGDILSDVVCARAGSPALCGSATINPDRSVRARRHGAVRARARLVAAPHRKPPLEPDRRLAGGRRPACLVPGSRRARPAHRGPPRARRRARGRRVNVRPGPARRRDHRP